MFELLLVDGDVETSLAALTTTPIYLGRAATNDVVLADPTVSSRHLALWVASGRVFVEDLRSRNGTFVGERPVRGAISVAPGEALRVGLTVRLVVRERAGQAGDHVGLLVEDLDMGVRYPLRSDRLVFGARGDVPVDVAEPVVVLVTGPGELYLGVEDDQQPLALDAPFSVGDRRFAVHVAPTHLTVTRDVATTRYPYALAATLDGPTGPEATLHHLDSDARYTVRTENRAVLLYLLARRLALDIAAGLPEAERGWCVDEDLIVGVWGRAAVDTDATSNLSVLVCRLRGELRRASFDAWFIERRSRYIRARVATAAVG